MPRLILSGATATQPARKGSGAPSGACVQGEQYFRTDATAGQNLYFCTSANNWTQMTGGGGAGNPTGATDPGTCTVGQLFFNTTGEVQKLCSVTNAWTPLRESAAGSGIVLAHVGSTTTVASDDAAMLSRATNQAATDIYLAPTGGSGTTYTACPTPSLTAQSATGSRWILLPDVASSANATLNICSQGALNLQKLVSGTLTNVAANDLRANVPYVVTKAASTYVVTPQEQAGQTRTFGVTIDGGGSTITTGNKKYTRVPFACKITKATVLADQSGSIVIDVWKDTYANYPPTVADTITASAKPTLSSAIKSEDSTLTGWTTTVAAGDTIGFNVDSATTVTWVQLLLECQI